LIDPYADRTITLFNKAKEGTNEDDYYQQARQSAEEGIAFLSEQNPSSTGTIEGTTFHLTGKRKAKILYRVSMAGEALGDRDAAAEHVQQCLKHEPETDIKLMKRIENLLADEQKVAGRVAVLWGEDDI
jgi:hypothetical protein